ncbi:DUF2922 domain-containing protein [Acetonema longum]|uniref:DUF2922 domain-containing protein n=1 Tax=Acetonema longum DSM 6540 TaxID=1009370 RepID=F7NJH1_9FIRM|nr:DUF2922 domain-containing protein [Acetonema longum]EGO63801.1 hypothetical protein ALO_11134 [Acetonema longum DSM 6540]
MNRTLEMVFRAANGREVTISLADPLENLTLADVTTVMEDIIARNIFITTGGELRDIVDARIRTRETVSLA